MMRSQKMGGQVYFVKYPKIDSYIHIEAMKMPYLVKVLDCLEILRLVVIFFSCNIFQGHPYFYPNDGENQLIQRKQIVPSIHIMIDRCYFSLDQ